MGKGRHERGGPSAASLVFAALVLTILVLLLLAAL
jgi:hypothetical protein